MSTPDFTLAGALLRLVDAIEAYDDCEEATVEELNDAEMFARAVLAANSLVDQRQRELLLGGAA